MVKDQSIILCHSRPCLNSPFISVIMQERLSSCPSSVNNGVTILSHLQGCYKRCGNPTPMMHKKKRITESETCLRYQEFWLHQPFSSIDIPQLLYLEHLIPMSHAGLLQLIHGRSQPSSCCWDLLGGLHYVRVRTWIGLSQPKHMSGLKPPTSSRPSFGYAGNSMSAGRAVGWMTGGALLSDISSCDDAEILGGLLLLSAGIGKEEWITYFAMNSFSTVCCIGRFSPEIKYSFYLWSVLTR